MADTKKVKKLTKEEEIKKAQLFLQVQQEEKNKEAVKKLEAFMLKELPEYVLDIQYQIVLRPKT